MSEVLFSELANADNGTWDLSKKVLVSVGWTVDELGRWRPPEGNKLVLQPHPTEDMNHALDLLDGRIWALSRYTANGENVSTCEVWNEFDEMFIGTGVTPQLAICAAAVLAFGRHD